MTLKTNHAYEFTLHGKIHYAIYIGREQGWECMICGHGHNAYLFNIYHGNKANPTAEEIQEGINTGDYETFSFGREHIPANIKEVL